MPRRARIQAPGYPIHVVQRGHNRAGCFLEESAYELYFGLLEQFRRRYACAIHAFVLMPNHVHLLMTPEDPPRASDFMRRVNLRFVQNMNRRYGRTGSGFEGRFWSSVVDTGSYLLRCQRYIELNPVRAGLVRRAEDYAWSSHACNAFGSPCVLIEPHAEFLALGGSEARRRAAYRALFLERLDDGDLSAIRRATRSNLPYASSELLAVLETQLGRPMRPGRPGPKRKGALLPGSFL
jgi:putative transposase